MLGLSDMKSFFKFSLTSIFIILPLLTFAAPSAQDKAATEAASFVAKFNEIILYPLIALLSAVAFLVFLWGCAMYFINATNDQARQQGVKHITFGIIGLVVMLSAFAILSIATSTFGLDKQLKCANNPSLSGCPDVFVIPASSAGEANSGNGSSAGEANSGNGSSAGEANSGR
jgi:uncharacterized membrane protein YgcG